MEDEPRRKRLKLSLTKKRPSHESSEGAVTQETAGPVTVVCDQSSATSVLDKVDTGPEAQLEPEPELASHAAEERREAYYSANFKSILKTVLSDSPESHVISENGAKVVERFMALPEPQQQLYVRLFLRKHRWIRAVKLSYKDIVGNLTEIVQALVDEDFLLDSSHLADPTEVLNLLQLGELKGLCRQLNMPTSLVGNQKTSIIQAMFKHDRQQKPLFGQAQFMKTVVTKAKKVLGNCIKVAEEPREEFSRLMLLFSLTNSWIGGEEDSSFSQLIYRMLQVNIGMVVYPEYEVNITHSLFHSTEDFEKYYVSTKHEQSMVQAMEEGDDAAVKRLLSGAAEAFKAELEKQDEATSSNQNPAHNMAPFLLPFTTGWTYTRMISQATEYLEKKKQHEQANELLELLLSQKLYCTGSRGRWADRLALNYDHHLKRKDKCLEMIVEALKDPYLHDSKRLSLLQRARKICLSQQNVSESKPKKKAALSKKRRTSSGANSPGVALPYGIKDFPMMDIIEAPELHITGHRLRTGPVYLTQNSRLADHSSTSSFDYQGDDQSPSVSTPSSTGTGHRTQTIVGVEGYAIQNYNTEQGWPCALHAEGSSFTTLFALLMWGVIFASGIPNVFRTKFQSGPLDLHSSCFYENRRTVINERLAVIGQASDEEISAVIEESWDEHYGQLCVGLNWELFPSKEDAMNLGVCMGGQLLSQICELFCKQYRQSVGGLPDLVLWNPTTRACKFVEVKGPGDRLSHKQIIWLSRLANWSCDVEVCWVAAKRNIS